MIHKCWFVVPEHQNNKKQMQLDDSVLKCLVLHLGATTAATTTSNNNNNSSFCPMLFGPRFRPSSPHPPPLVLTEFLPRFFLVLTFHSAHESACFLESKTSRIETFIRPRHLQFHWRNELPKMLKSKVPNLSLSHSSLPISILLLSSMALPWLSTSLGRHTNASHPGNQLAVHGVRADAFGHEERRHQAKIWKTKSSGHLPIPGKMEFAMNWPNKGFSLMNLIISTLLTLHLTPLKWCPHSYDFWCITLWPQRVKL